MLHQENKTLEQVVKDRGLPLIFLNYLLEMENLHGTRFFNNVTRRIYDQHDQKLLADIEKDTSGRLFYDTESGEGPNKKINKFKSKEEWIELFGTEMCELVVSAVMGKGGDMRAHLVEAIRPLTEVVTDSGQTFDQLLTRIHEAHPNTTIKELRDTILGAACYLITTSVMQEHTIKSSDDFKTLQMQIQKEKDAIKEIFGGRESKGYGVYRQLIDQKLLLAKDHSTLVEGEQVKDKKIITASKKSIKEHEGTVSACEKEIDKILRELYGNQYPEKKQELEKLLGAIDALEKAEEPTRDYMQTATNNNSAAQKKTTPLDYDKGLHELAQLQARKEAPKDQMRQRANSSASIGTQRVEPKSHGGQRDVASDQTDVRPPSKPKQELTGNKLDVPKDEKKRFSLGSPFAKRKAAEPKEAFPGVPLNAPKVSAFPGVPLRGDSPLPPRKGSVPSSPQIERSSMAKMAVTMNPDNPTDVVKSRSPSPTSSPATTPSPPITPPLETMREKYNEIFEPAKSGSEEDPSDKNDEKGKSHGM